MFTLDADDVEVLRLEELTGGYAETRVLNSVSLSISAGEVLALLGRNGVGKTTLLRVIVGLARLTSGLITVQGRNLTGRPAHVLAREGVAYVPQGRGIFGKLTVKENLMLGTRALGNRADRKSERFEFVYSLFPILKERVQQQVGTLSGGEQQMLAIGRALCGDPKILLLDEPSEGVQPNIVGEMRGLIKRLAAEYRLGILLVEQNLDLATMASDRYMVMEKGEIVAEGSSVNLLNEEGVGRYLAI